MKLALIAIGLLTTIPPAFARGGGMHSEEPWNPQHINGLPNTLFLWARRSNRSRHSF